MKMELGLFTAGLTRIRTNPGIPLLDPPPVTKAEAMARDVASYAAESLRVQSRLMRLCVQWEERAGEAAFVADSRLANRAASDDDDASEVDHANALTSSALAALCAAAGPNPLVAARRWRRRRRHRRARASNYEVRRRRIRSAPGPARRGSTPARCERTSAARCGGTRRRSRTSARASPRRFCGCRSRESRRWSAAGSGRRRTRVHLSNPARVPAGSRGPAVGPDGERHGGVSADPRRRAVVARRPRRRSRLLEGVIGAGWLRDGGSLGSGASRCPRGRRRRWAPPPRAPPRTSVSPGNPRISSRPCSRPPPAPSTRWSARPWSRCRCPRFLPRVDSPIAVAP